MLVLAVASRGPCGNFCALQLSASDNLPARSALQFERERSRALSKDLLEARERWQATEAERAAAEDARRCGGVPEPGK